jgi:hypothetical protein
MSPIDIFFSAPPISRYVSPHIGFFFRSFRLTLTNHRTLAAVIFTFSVLLYTNLLPYSFFNLYLGSLLQLPPQLWRIFTSILITGPQLGILFGTYFCKSCLHVAKV